MRFVASSITEMVREKAQLPAVTVKAGLRIFSKVLVVAVFFLIFLGANVTSHDAGLAVPDWPTSYGYNMFTFPISYWVGGIFHEHFHRLVASAIGALTVILAAWIWIVDRRRWVKMLSLGAVVAVILQGLLGGLTVLMQLPAWTSSLHGILGQSFFCITIAVAFSQSRELLEPTTRIMRATPITLNAAVALMALIFGQLILAAFMRHTESGLAIPDFPTMAGSWIPSLGEQAIENVNQMRRALGFAPVQSYQMLLHLLHRAVAFVIVGVGLWALWRAMSRSKTNPKIRKTLAVWGILTMIQCTLGIIAVLTVRAPYPTSIHVLVGALLLGTSMMLVLRVGALNARNAAEASRADRE